MKKPLQIIALVFCMLSAMSFHSKAQFIPMPLNFPNTSYVVDAMAIVDADTLWTGVIKFVGGNFASYPVAVKTHDGGNTWLRDTITTGSNLSMSCITAVNGNIAYYFFLYNSGNGEVWKTTDGGTTWAKKTTTEFTGGYADIIYAYNADSVFAIGDPNGGYFEVQITGDGGNTWTRIPSTNIPTPLNGEYSYSSAFGVYGNNIWFMTNKARCFHSADRGLTWTVSQVFSGNVINVAVPRFADANNGVVFNNDDNNLYLTSDGGATWIATPLDSNRKVAYGDVVEMAGNTFVYSVAGTSAGTIDMYFTPDHFTTNILIEAALNSVGIPEFKDINRGWLSGNFTFQDNIYKFSGALGINDFIHAEEQLAVWPNPANNEVFVKVPQNGKGNKCEWNLYEMNGKQVSSVPATGNSGCQKINTSSLEDGVYVIELKSDSQLLGRQKVIVRH